MAIAERAVASRVGRGRGPEDARDVRRRCSRPQMRRATTCRRPNTSRARRTASRTARSRSRNCCMLWLANANPAFERVPRSSSTTAPLVERSAYRDVIAGLVAHFATQPPFGPDEPDARRDAARAGARGAGFDRRTAALHPRALDAHPRRASLDRLVTQPRRPRRGGGRRSGAGSTREGPAATPRTRRGGHARMAAPSRAGRDGGETDVERFSVDRDWMPRLVLIAKSTYVWLDQLSKRYGRHIGRLDEIPDEELDQLARRGLHRPLADRALGAQPRRRRRSSSCAATPRRSRPPTRSTTTTSPTTSAARARSRT